MEKMTLEIPDDLFAFLQGKNAEEVAVAALQEYKKRVEWRVEREAEAAIQEIFDAMPITHPQVWGKYDTENEGRIFSVRLSAERRKEVSALIKKGVLRKDVHTNYQKTYYIYKA